MADIVTLSPVRAHYTTTPSMARYAGLTLAATGLVAICAHVAVPLFFTPVPITLQTLAVLFLGLMMSPRWAFATLTLYLLEGAVGLPVFSPHGPGGVLQLFGPTGGYLLSYPFATAAAGWIFRRLAQRVGPESTGARFVAALLSAFTAGLVILAAGATWLGVLTHRPAHTVIALAVIPFLVGDVVKVCLAASAFIGIDPTRLRTTPDQTGSAPGSDETVHSAL